MSDLFTKLLSTSSPELTTFLLSMTPIGELRLGIPWGISMYHFSPIKAFVIAFLGNSLINIVLYYLIVPIINWMERSQYFWGKMVVWIKDHLKKKGQKYLDKWGVWGVFIISLTPLPGFGGWTGAGVAALLEIEAKKAIPALTAGTFIAGIIVVLGAMGIIKII